jgi:cytochrome c oxidase cbb3-type subunit 3
MNKMKLQLLGVVCAFLWIGSFIPLSVQAQEQEESPMLNALLKGGTIEQATESVIRAINSHNYSFVRQQSIDSHLVPQAWEAKSVRIIYFCNFDAMSRALALDTRASEFLPCRITLIETRDGVELMAVNPAWVSLRMGNYRLHEHCLKLKEDYQAIMNEATL